MKTIFTKKQNSDAGSAFVLILLLIGYFFKKPDFYIIAIPALFINLVTPSCYYPFSVIWYNLSDYAGRVMSAILLSVIYVILVFPVGTFRKLMGKDLLSLKSFKKDSCSVFKTRDILFTKENIEKPY